jgi:predicted unusual protein kinase regulating ubiquinone biosynthesis (AarF/ABC1/UbiB family)
MKEQDSIATGKVERSAKFIKTGIKVGGNYLKHYTKKLFDPELTKEELNNDNAQDIYQSLSELKGSALKVAQMLSMDKSILPKAYVDQFSKSQYNAPPLSGPLIVRTFSKYFGKTPDKIFDTFEIKSSNAASIGQVHKATKDGKKLAVKIQYPGVAESISSDLKLVKPFAFRLLGMSEKELDVYMKEVEQKMLEETDYVLEVEQSQKFAEACKSLSNISFPNYYPEYSSPRIITMDWIEGLHLKEFLAINPTQEERNVIGQALWDFYQFQQHTLRAMHADPHPGNFLVTPDGKLGVLDFGCIKELPNDFYEPYFQLILGDTLNNKEKKLECFRALEMILPQDDANAIDFYVSWYTKLIRLFAEPYMKDTFDFADQQYMQKLYEFGEMISRMPEFKQARGVKHFIYVNRTNFGLYAILSELGAKVKTAR